MLKDVKQFEMEIEGKIGRFTVEFDTPLTVAKEMLFQFLKVLGQIEDQYKALPSNSVPVSTEENIEPEKEVA